MKLLIPWAAEEGILPSFCVPTMCLSAPRMDSMDMRFFCWYNYYSLEFHSPPRSSMKRIPHPVSADFWKQEPMSPVHVFKLDHTSLWELPTPGTPEQGSCLFESGKLMGELPGEHPDAS